MTGMGAGLAGGIVAAVLIVVSCGSDVQTSSASGTTAGGGATTSSTQGPASTSTGGSCDPGYSAGCCFGDGYCCPCVGFYCAPAADHAAIEAFQQCACAAGVCATECQIACQGGGIDGACFVCASKVAQTTCAAEFAGCSGTLPFACPPATCEACEACSSWSACNDAWNACWFDADCRALMLCADSCLDLACQVNCAAGNPPGAALFTSYLECTYCNDCSLLCDISALSCPGP